MSEQPVAQRVDVAVIIETIKRDMPETYKAIKAKAAEIGNVAFELVRKGLRGEANCFYAFEAGRVVGTPFAAGPLPDHVARMMVEFGCAFVCIFHMPEGQA